MTKAATFTEAELRRAMRVAEDHGKTVSITKKDEGVELVFVPETPAADPVREIDMVDMRR